MDTTAAEPPFRQLQTQIRESIASGALPTGTQLPTVRALAEQVGVAANTAAKAYRELEESGVLESRGRSGTFVAEPTSALAALARAADELVQLAASAGLSHSDVMAAVMAASTRRD